MPLTKPLLCVILCSLVPLGWAAEVEATADMPTVVEAIIHAMINFRKEILDNLQLSLEYHTEQLEEIKSHVDHEIAKLNTQCVANYEMLHARNIASESKLKKLQKATKRFLNESSSQIYKIDQTLVEIRRQMVPKSCDWVEYNSTGIFKINPFKNVAKAFLVLCYIDNTFDLGGDWTVFQRRFNGSLDFDRSWEMYKHGFGDVTGEYWLGLEKLYVMTKSGRHELLVLLEDFEGNLAYTLYDEFKVGSEKKKYMLTLGRHSGTAGDSMKLSRGVKFSTLDQYNFGWGGVEKVATSNERSWWIKTISGRYINHTKMYSVSYRILMVFFFFCSHLNGPYFKKGEHKKIGMSWDTFRYPQSLKSATMMFRDHTSN
ncbi:AGAP004917-PA-like protein [Anopheles sinensis]|uniref:AGAP004917-PA-like protein n=1 Tax=Anopheles sinensis TaxID=74873 RepID=A0A084WBM1_ANOSI|nr:AGAP004917-PA-like protein [Anopheles sinensis]